MPWAKLTYERTITIYKEIMEDLVSSLDGNIDLKIKEILIRSEIQKRDFTKRQLNILNLIVTFSFSYGKESALLKSNDFSLCGVPPKKINAEINKLIEFNVIKWDKDFNEFSIIEPRFWNGAPYHDHYDDNRSRELFILNLKHAGFDVAPIIEKLNKMDM